MLFGAEVEVGITTTIKRLLPRPVRSWLGHVVVLARYTRQYGLDAFLGGFRAPLPRLVRIEPASACNLRCSHCPTGWAGRAGDPNRDIMKPELFNRVVAEIAKAKSVVQAVFYFAGEPLLNRWFPDMLRRIKQETSVKFTQFSTNAMLLSDEAVNRLEGTGVDLIHISIDGDSPQENDEIRLRGKYDRIRENALNAKARLGATGTRVRIHNIQVPEVEEIGTKPKAPQFLVDDFGRDGVDVHHAIRWPGLDDRYLKARGFATLKKRDPGTKTGEHFCTMPFKEMVIQANGDVTVCCYDITGELKMGNIQFQTLEEIWNGPEYRKLRKAIASFGLLEPLPETCRKCHIYSSELVVRPPKGATAPSLAGPSVAVAAE